MDRARDLPLGLLGYAGLALALAPVLWPGAVGPAPPAWLEPLGLLLVLAVPVAAVGLCARHLELGPTRRDHLATVALLVALTFVGNDLHRTMVDEASDYVPRALHATSTGWQEDLHRRALALDPSIIPHSYRVLPHALLRWGEAATGSFEVARAAYRHTCVFLLLVTTVVWARRRFRHPTVLLGVALFAAVWPITFRFYAGQPADPLSHLSFALALVLIDDRRTLPLCLVLSAGVLAKESVATLAVYLALFRRGEAGHLARAAAALAAALLPALAVRLAVSAKAGGFGYERVSGVGPGHVLDNLRDAESYTQVGLSLGPFLPFFVLAWPRCPRDLRTLVPFLLATLLGSSLLFSWLQEARNFVPVIIPLALVTAAWLLDDPGLAREDGATPSTETATRPSA